jgi:hypothetical protein
MATSRRSFWFWLFVILSSLLVINDLIIPLIVSSSYVIDTYFSSFLSSAIALITIILPSLGIIAGLVLLLRRN